MAKEVPQNYITNVRVWTFMVVGGHPGILEIEEGPDFIHHGKRTLWQWFGSEAGSNQIEVKIQELVGECVEIRKYGHEISDETKTLRSARNGNFSLMTPKVGMELSND